MATSRPTKSQARMFAQLIAEYEPRVWRAFMASVTDLQAGVDWSELLRSLERGDTMGAVVALHIDPAAWGEYSAIMTEVYAKSGASTAAQISAWGPPGGDKSMGGAGIRFRMTNPGAQDWIRRNVAERVVGFAQEQTQIARSLIEVGYAQGQGPRNIALDLVGRAAGGSLRTGGVLGLDAPRAARLHKVVQGMRTSQGVQELVRKHADGSLSVVYKVNAATEKRILKAYKAGTEVPGADRVISERQYQNALLKARADTVAETETGNAVMSARAQEWEQLAQSRGLDKTSVIKTWRHGRGASVHHRPDHLAMSGKSVHGLDTPFVFPDGAKLQHAHDTNGGARHTIRCGCETEYRLDHSVGLE